MLALTFQIDGARWGVRAQDILEVIPFVELRAGPPGPAWLRGAAQFRGAPVPVMDLAVLAGASASRERLSTRILMVRLREQPELLAGLLVEQATDTCPLASTPPVVAPNLPAWVEARQDHAGQPVRLVRPDRLPVQEDLAQWQAQAGKGAET